MFSTVLPISGAFTAGPDKADHGQGIEYTPILRHSMTTHQLVLPQLCRGWKQTDQILSEL